MATKRKKSALISSFNAEEEAKEDALFESTSRDINIVRSAGIINGMEPAEIRRRILLAASPPVGEPEKA